MKLAKKMLASVLALALVAALALTAFAANAEFVVTAPKTAVVGDTITVTLSGKNLAGLESADLVMTYDSEILEYVGANKDGIANLEATVVAGVPTPGEATCSIMALDAVETDADLAKYSFKVVKEGEITFGVQVNSCDGVDAASNDSAAKLTALVEAPTTPSTVPSAPSTSVPPVEDNSGAATSTKPSITQTGEASIAAIAGVMAIAAVAFVATRKKDEE